MTRLLVFSLVLCSAQAYAAKWVQLADDDDSSFYIDIDSVRSISPYLVGSSSTDRYLSVFSRIDFNDGARLSSGEAYTHTIQYNYINCDMGSYFVKSFRMYNNREVVASDDYTIEDESEFKIAYPTTPPDDIIRTICV